MFNTSLTLKKIQSTFKIGSYIYYACILPEFEWFAKKFSIKKLLEPTKYKITETILTPDYINNDDRFLLSRMSFTGAIRKYKFYVKLTNEIDFNIDIFENYNKDVIILYEHYIIIDKVKKNVLEDFYKLIITLKSDIDFNDSHTKVVKDTNFILFKNLYIKAADLYPEEVIKSHDKK